MLLSLRTRLGPGSWYRQQHLSGEEPPSHRGVESLTPGVHLGRDGSGTRAPVQGLSFC